MTHGMHQSESLSHPSRYGDLRLRHVRIGTQAAPQPVDLVIRDGIIAAIDPPAAAAPRAGETVIEAGALVAFPGFVNAHAHSNEQFEQGAYEGEPLEVWLAMAYPPLGGMKVPARWHYLRAMMLAMQSLRSGVTALHDDFLNPALDAAALESTLDAYEDAGIRATVAVTLADRGYLDGIPAAREHLPRDLARQLDAVPVAPLSAQQAHFEEALCRLAARRSRRLALSLGPRGPQRCTPELLRLVARLSAEHKVPVHMHVLESRVQALTAQQQHGRSFIEVLDQHGLLGRSLSLNHAIWLTEADIGLIARRGARVVHNPLSNLKLASGLCPVGSLLESGVEVALGTDGAATGDSVDYLDSLRMAALLHRLHPQAAPPTAADVVTMATTTGAATMGQSSSMSGLQVGSRADITLFDATDPAFVPLNDPQRQLCYAATSRSVHTVIVDGQVVYHHGRCVLVDEDTLRHEIAQAADAFREQRLRMRGRPDPLLRALQAMTDEARAPAQRLFTLNRIQLP
ncbi:MAG: amidohydrolase family protein [Pigmentiphaga sp.]|uniref:amidohydrolase family protein n=1 Tax=Pigmentiphaga sp. TaxID=1977564 RepID=UPI0029BDE0B2|nr:amidohydrolase family protein [Pigmentiphaga sp.]MDX3904842.1 amidohydrolase family protein [Pigmentiphaga sp.]